MMIKDRKQDVYTQEETAAIVKGLPKGRYQIDIGSGSDCKISQIKNQWLQREDIT